MRDEKTAKELLAEYIETCNNLWEEHKKEHDLIYGVAERLMVMTLSHTVDHDAKEHIKGTIEVLKELQIR